MLAIYQLQLLALSKSATIKNCEKHLLYAKVKNYNLNVTEVLVSKTLFPGIFNFTVGILSSTIAVVLAPS